jgi:hypothetical protein
LYVRIERIEEIHRAAPATGIEESCRVKMKGHTTREFKVHFASPVVVSLLEISSLVQESQLYSYF